MKSTKPKPESQCQLSGVEETSQNAVQYCNVSAHMVHSNTLHQEPANGVSCFTSEESNNYLEIQPDPFPIELQPEPTFGNSDIRHGIKHTGPDTSLCHDRNLTISDSSVSHISRKGKA